MFEKKTLVSIAQNGDIVVPYASSSITRKSPYEKGPLIVSKSKDWKWKCGYSNFENPSLAVLQRGGNHVLTLRKHEEDAIEGQELLGDDQFIQDDHYQVEFPYSMYNSLRKVPWRRIDLFVEPANFTSMIKLHDYPMAKQFDDTTLAFEFIEMMVNILVVDIENNTASNEGQ